MTLMEMFGCGLVAFSPTLVMFAFTIAGDPLKIIILTCSAFFWLISLLLSAVVWYAIVPLREWLVFGMIVSVIFQEAIRVGYYFFLKKAESGLQKIASAEEAEEPPSTPPTTATAYDGPGDDAATVASSAPASSADRVSLTSVNARKILNLRSLSYVCGLGFGLMSSAFAMVNLLADVSGPGTVGWKGEHPGFLLVSACLACEFACLNVCWTVATFACLEARRAHWLGAVWTAHLLCSVLTLLNSPTDPLMSLAPILTALACLVACLVLCLALVGGNIQGFLVSLVSPRWMRSCGLRRRPI